MIIGFPYLPSIHFKFITKCDDYYKARQNTVNIRDLNGNFRQRFQEDKYSLELSIKYVTPFVTLFTLLVFACCVVISRSIAI